MRKTRFAVTVALTLALAWGTCVSRVAFAVERVSDSHRFRHDGPNAETYGIGENYPRCLGLAFVQQPRCRVGAFSEFDKLFPARSIRASKEPTPFHRATTEPIVRYTFAAQERTLEQYFNSRPITGLLIAKDDTILFERYQYGRTDQQKLASFSMAKSIVGMLIGIAIEEGAIRSINDVAETYVPALKGTVYGRTPIKALLQMRSGVSFREDYADPASDIYTLARLTLEQSPGGSLAAVKRFNRRRAPAGELYSYSSADTVVLGLVLAAATGRSVSDYAAAKLWQPLGTEADASWIIDATGHEVTFAYFNAVLRDYARIGRMLAADGVANGKPVVPKTWLRASMDEPVDTDSTLSRYGYHIWLSADATRFMLRGLRGQYILADPETKLVLVQTSLDSSDFLDFELFVLWTAAREQLR